MNDQRKSGRPKMEQAVCANCGKQCEVPFKPTGDKPVYCSECFEKFGDKRFNKRDKGPGFGKRGERRDDRRGNNRPNYRSDRNREMFSATCDECGKECQVPFKPTNDKPVYCSDCFEKKNRYVPNKGTNYEGKSKDMKQLREQFDKLNKKVDAMMELLLTLTESKKVTKKHPSKKKEAAQKVETKSETPEPKVEDVQPEVTVYETPEQLAETKPTEEVIVNEPTEKSENAEVVTIAEKKEEDEVLQ